MWPIRVTLLSTWNTARCHQNLKDCNQNCYFIAWTERALLAQRISCSFCWNIGPSFSVGQIWYEFILSFLTWNSNLNYKVSWFIKWASYFQRHGSVDVTEPNIFFCFQPESYSCLDILTYAFFVLTELSLSGVAHGICGILLSTPLRVRICV
jgi:hypothetical protein